MKGINRILKLDVFLIKDIGMKLMFGPEVRYVRQEGNEGLTAVAIIETSHVALHVWDKQTHRCYS